jgi:aminoglycoside 3-N-acetyltransferase
MIQSEKSCSSTACYREQLAREWASSGIKHGDVVILHSSLSRTLKHYAGAASKITPKDILESFLQAVGPNGTIVFPTFNFDFTFGAPFDRGSTPSHMGILGEMARQDVRSYRTAHPVYSFAVIGADQEKFREKKNISAWGEDSPFATVHELDGYIRCS